jgi:hypothetical protein
LKYLLDTNIVSEPLRPKPHHGVVRSGQGVRQRWARGGTEQPEGDHSLKGYRALRYGRHLDLIVTDQHSYRSADRRERRCSRGAATFVFDRQCRRPAAG